MKLSQYLAAGKPVVSTKVGDIPDYLDATGAGRLVSDNPEALAGMVYRLSSQPETLKEMSEASASLAQKPELSWEARGKQLEKIYQELTTADQ